MSAVPIPDAPEGWSRPVRRAEPLDKANLPSKFSAKLAGVSFAATYPHNLLALDGSEPLSLLREPENQYDPNAVAVVVYDHVIGHLPKALAARVAPEIDHGRRWAITSHTVLVQEGYEDRPSLSVDLERAP